MPFMLHGDEFGVPDWILMTLAPPVVGAAIGLLIGLRRTHFAAAGFGGALGGTLGAWLGVLIYRIIMDQVIGGRDMIVFAVCVDGLFVPATVVLAWILRGAPASSRPMGLLGCQFLAACAFAILLGTWMYAIACEPSAFIPIDESVKYFGIAAILGGAGTLAGGLCWMRGKRFST